GDNCHLFLGPSAAPIFPWTSGSDCSGRSMRRAEGGNGRRIGPSGRLPQLERDPEGVDAPPCPPIRLVARPVGFAVMHSAGRDRELVAHLSTERPNLGETQVMWIRGFAGAHKAGTRSDELQMGLVAVASDLRECQYGLVIPIRRFALHNRRDIACGHG